METTKWRVYSVRKTKYNTFMSFLKKYWVYFALIAIFLLTRIPRLNNDIISTDAVYWHGRTEEFIKAIQTKNFVQTYQKYHPGVTLMWIMAISTYASSLFTGSTIQEIISNPVIYHYYAKIGMVLWQLGISILLLTLLSKIFGKTKAFLIVLLFTIEPFFIGNSRLLHHDVQISLYLLTAFALAYLYLKENKISKLVLASLFLALAVLSKTLFLGAVLYMLGTLVLYRLLNKQIKFGVKDITILLTVFAAFYVLLFPAMWVAPVEIITRIFEESFYAGAEAGHKQIFFGELTRDPGPLFYIVLFGLKLSLVTLVGFILYFLGKIINLIKNKSLKFDSQNIPFELFAGLFYLGYFLVLTYFSKKVDRYIVPFIPYICLVAVLGWYQFKGKIAYIFVILFASFSIIYPLIKVFPHYLVYNNPVFGDAKRGNEIVGQKLFGIAVYDLRDFIIKNYGETKVATYDPGPLSTIYNTDKVFDISETHPNSYNYLILGPNKDFPRGVVDSGIRFVYKDSIVVNGLEFWKIYKKFN